MKNKELIIFLLVILTLPGYCQHSIRFVVYFGPTEYDYKDNCSYIVHYPDDAVKKLTYTQFISKVSNDSTFCSSFEELEIEPKSYFKDLFKSRNISCDNLTEREPIVLPEKYSVSADNDLETDLAHGFDGYDPKEMGRIILFNVDDRYSQKLRALKDSIAEFALGSRKLAENLSITGAAVPTLAEYRQVKADTAVYCRLLFNPARMEELSGDHWVICGVLLHEFGHLVGQHGVNRERTNFDNELDADFYAGYNLYDFHADTIQAVRMLNLVSDTIVNSYYPEKTLRRQSILKGWSRHDSVNKAIIKAYNDANLLLIAKISLSLDSLKALWNQKSAASAEIKARMDEIRTKIDGIDCGPCSAELNKLNASYYFSSGRFKGSIRDYTKAASYYNRLIDQHLDYNFECGEANFNATAYGLALEYFGATDTSMFDQKKSAYLHYMEGVSWSRVKEPDLQNALKHLTLAVNLGTDRANAYERRAEVKQLLYPDSLVSAIEDYYRMLKFTEDSTEAVKINSKIASLADKAYKSSLYGKKNNPGFSAATMSYLARRPVHMNFRDIQYQVADCYMVLYDTTHQVRYLDSAILHASAHLALSQMDFSALVLRGKAFYFKAITGDFEKEGVSALADLTRIPEAEKDLYGEASYYEIDILIRKDENNNSYCHILEIFNSVNRNYWRDRIKPLICANYEKLDTRKCMNAKQRGAVKKLCKN
jgi:hypothetical protein